MKTVICGLWHVHAEGYYKTAAEYTDVIGVYEPNETWRKEFCAKYNLPEFATLEELLACGADAAIVCTSTDTHADVIVRLAEAGMDIFSEKVLALTSEECAKIKAAVEKNGVRFVISYPHKYGAGAQTVKMVIDSGELGKINFFRCRNVHDGSTGHWLPLHFYNAKECGGGAMIDLGAHGMYLSEWICGMPVAAKSVFTVACDHSEVTALNTDGVEDNAVTVMQYADGCIAINETGFDSTGYPLTLEVCGENGWVRYSGSKVEMKTKTADGVVEVPMEPALPAPLVQFCTGDILPGCGMAEAVNLTKLMEMAYAGK
ncbi:MAG: Gfo/Idh/MocA family oxidoreductase [Clostridia bacterium]|nr:Gfo/Idh/MocA family oxidoreductase [Clostridia bacterium]